MTKVTELSPDTTPTGDDLVVLVNDPGGGTPTSVKVTLSNLVSNYLSTLLSDIGSVRDVRPIVGTTDTLGATDAGKIVEATDASATTITIPATTFDEGDIIQIVRAGSGTCTIEGAAGSVTVNGTLGGSVVIQNQWGSAVAYRRTTDNEWVVSGDVA